ncbi:unnamed protein product [Bemisia tabaci]|uniref:Uncharacterized protein n=1 Tax=Bemisia tabaci TaxID=7038 RepID=A0A9P0ALL8_BEMTA|nr:unnamed protein product [Bemisia tabaci]
MCLRLTLLFLCFVGLVVSRKLLYIQVITKDLKSNRILECVQMDPTENESLDAVVKEAARVSGPVKKNFFKKIVGLQKKEKKAFECLGTTIDVTKPLWMCKKVGKVFDKSIRPILCHQDVSMVFVVKREKAKDHDVYGFCIDPAKFFVFHYLPDTAHCEPDERGFAKTGSGNLQTALIVQPYVPKGCVSSVLAYLEEKDFVIVPNWTRPGHVEKMTECFFKTLRSTIDYKRELRVLAGQFLQKDSPYMQEARRRKMVLEPPTVENPFITKEDLKTLHESVFTTVVNALSPEHRLKKYKHKLYLEPRHIDTVDQFFLTAVAEARRESASNYQPPQKKLLKIDEPNKLTVRQALRIFIISQTKYRRLLVGMLILIGRIHDTCEFMGTQTSPAATPSPRRKPSTSSARPLANSWPSSRARSSTTKTKTSSSPPASGLLAASARTRSASALWSPTKATWPTGRPRSRSA